MKRHTGRSPLGGVWRRAESRRLCMELDGLIKDGRAGREVEVAGGLIGKQ